MRKILALLILSFVLTSCFNKAEDTPTNDNTGTVVKDTTNDDLNSYDTNPIIIDDNGDNTILIDDNGDNTIIIDDNTTLNDSITDTIPETNSADEEILEDEVNALLDEFIDSLDNYDK